MWHHNTTMQHEAMHALGFHHEHTRPDRDDFVEMHPSVAGNSNYAELTPDSWVNTNSPYDFDSIMHYPSSWMGGLEYSMTVPGSNYQTPITANRVYPFSEEDIKQINYAYCSESTWIGTTTTTTTTTTTASDLDLFELNLFSDIKPWTYTDTEQVHPY